MSRTARRRRHAPVSSAALAELSDIRAAAPLRTRMTVRPNSDHRFHARLEDTRLANELELTQGQALELFEDLQRFLAECERLDEGADVMRVHVEVFR